MTRGRALGILLALWLLALGIVLQPHDHPGPIISHARLLDRPPGDLPTLGPVGR
jgi:hypothetical protein